MADGFDLTELSDFNKQLVDDAIKNYPKEMKSFLKKEANKVQEVAKNIAKTEITEHTGNYMKGFKVGKSGLKGAYAIKAYNQAPHGHLIENGHWQYGGEKNKTKLRFIEGKKIYAKAHTQFKSQFEKDAEEFAGELLYKSVMDKHIKAQADNLGVSVEEIEKYL